MDPRETYKVGLNPIDRKLSITIDFSNGLSATVHIEKKLEYLICHGVYLSALDYLDGININKVVHVPIHLGV